MIQEPLLLIPGMMCDARIFLPQITALSAYRSVSVVPPVGKRTMHDLATQTLRIAPEKFALAGLSMGGIVAMEVIRLAPERVSRLALLDTNPFPDPPDKAELRSAQVEAVRAGELSRVMKEEMKPFYLANGSNNTAILDVCMVMAQTLGAQIFDDQTAAISTRRDQCDTLENITVPTVLACGADDRLCPVERHELMHRLIPDSRLEVIPDAGHLPTLEKPEHTNEVLNKWLKM